jgi:hypothetical protein
MHQMDDIPGRTLRNAVIYLSNLLNGKINNSVPMLSSVQVVMFSSESEPLPLDLSISDSLLSKSRNTEI